MKGLMVILTCIALSSSAQVVPNFSLTNVSTGQYTKLADYSSSAGVAIIFTSTDCPYDTYYLSRIQNLASTYQSKIAVLLINSNMDESMEQMKKFADQNNLSTPYLWDLEQKIMTSLGAHKSPECFLLQPAGENFKVVYKGAIDDNPQAGSSVDQPYLKNAIDKLLAKQKIEPAETRPVGCSIR